MAGCLQSTGTEAEHMWVKQYGGFQDNADNDPTKIHVQTLLKFPHRRKDIGVYELKESSVLRF